jgi:hypothetical protein
MMMKKWAAEKQFTLDCPICREPALPQQVNSDVKRGWALIHPGRIASCFVKEDTDAAESIRTDFNGIFGTNVTSIANQDVTDEIRTLTEWSKTLVAPIDPISEDEWERYREICYRHTYPEIDGWENEGGTLGNCTYQD